MKVYKDFLLIISSFLVVFLWQISQFKDYSVPFVGFLIFLFLLISIKNKSSLNLGGPVNFFILNTILLLFIFSTGGLASNLFFLIYFLLFAAAFIMDPRTVFLVPVGLALVFWSEIFDGDVISNLIKIGSFAVLSPLAYFFGQQFKKSSKAEDEILKTKERAAESGEEIAKDVQEVIESGKGKLDSEEIKRLNEALEEAQDLKNEK